MSPTSTDPDAKPPRGFERRALRALVPYLWPRRGIPAWKEMRWRVVLALVFLVSAKLANITVPLLFKEAVDGLSGETADVIALPIAILIAYGAVRLGTTAFQELRDAVFARVAQRAIRTVAVRIFGHLHRLALRFHLERRTGGLSRAIERGTKGIEFLLSFTLFNVLPTLFEILVVCGILWAMFSIWFALVTFVTIAGYIAFTVSVTDWRLKYRRAMNRTDEDANTKAIDSLINFETVKYFGNEAHEGGRYDRAMERYEDAAVKSRTSLALLNMGQGGVIAVGLTLLMYMAGSGVVNGTMTLGDFVLVNTYLIQLYMPLNFLGFVYREIRQSLTDMERMFALLEVEPEVEDKPGAPDLAVTGGAVRFENVSFGYDGRRGILHGVDFEVPPGRTVAIVGPTGSGKSTISRLLFRFYDVDAGRVLIDGQDVRDVTQASLRAAIGIVPQDTVLFNDTIRYNIAYGWPRADQGEIERAARLARIHDFIAGLPDGYETRVGERGLKLSGGEKQRVAIARTILKGPRILLFDEATSALDTHTEREIQASLREVSADRTTLVIAHRLSTVVDADEIIVLNDGRIVERGSHAALLRADGAYAAMWRRQQEAAERGEVEDSVEDAAIEGQPAE